MALGTTRKITAGVLIASAVATAIAGLGLYGTRRLTEAAGMVSHTQNVLGALEAVSRHVDGAKADVRGYLITRDPIYLARHGSDIAAAESAFARAQQLTSDNPAQQTRLAAVRTLLNDREAALDATIRLAPPGQSTSPAISERLTIGERLSARVDSMVDAASTEEERLLAARAAREHRAEELLTFASVLIVLMTIVAALALRRSLDRDLTGRARAEEELRASEAKFSGILAIAADAIISVDAQQNIVHFNLGAHEMFGYEPVEVIGKPLTMLLPARHAEVHRAHVDAFAKGPELARRMGARRQVFGRRKNGEEFPAEASLSKLATPGGMLFTAVVRDMTEHKRLEQYEHTLAVAGVELGKSLDYDETLATAAALPVPTIGAWSLLDVIEETESGMTLLRRVAGKHPDPAVDAVIKEWASIPLDLDSPEPVVDVLRTGEALLIPEVTSDWAEAHLAGEQEIAFVRRLAPRSLLVVPLLSNGRAVAAWTIGSAPGRAFDDYDLTLAKALAERAEMALARARLFRAAQHATTSRDRVLSMVSHDLRNPLSAVSMFARRLLESRLTEDELHETGGHILRSVDWMHRLMQDLLDVASIEAGRLSIEIESASPGQIVEAALDMFEARATEQSIALRAEIDAAVPLAAADASRVVQVLGNLIGNALKYTAANGVVTVAARRLGAEVLFSVRDTGEGIPPEDLPRIFDRFWHARRGSATHGAGLGLAIAQGIVHAHGGRIWAESTLGHGTTFYFTLPMADRGATAPVTLHVPPGLQVS